MKWNLRRRLSNFYLRNIPPIIFLVAASVLIVSEILTLFNIDIPLIDDLSFLNTIIVLLLIIIYSLLDKKPDEEYIQNLNWDSGVVPNLENDIKRADTIDIFASSSHTFFSVLERLIIQKPIKIRLFLREVDKDLQKQVIALWEKTDSENGPLIEIFQAPHHLMRGIVFNLGTRSAWGYINFYKYVPVDDHTAFEIHGHYLPNFKVDQSTILGRHILDVLFSRSEYFLNINSGKNSIEIKL